MYQFDSRNLIAIPGGEFRMGQADAREEEQPVHSVSVKPFRLCLYQVTNAEYDEFLRATNRALPPFRTDPLFGCPNQPVVGVSWFDAVAYCDWLAAVTAIPCRLPTEAEWERAARAGLDQKLYPWGDKPIFERENYRDRWLHAPEPVGKSQPNAFGLFEMCENVHEWCSDWYDPSYYRASPAQDPRGPESGTRRSSRGGAWRHHLKISRCAARSSIPPEFKYADYGFRIAAAEAR